MKKMMIVHAETYQLIAGEEAYKAATERGDTEVEVLLCDPTAPEIVRLAALNRDESRLALKENKEFGYIDPWQFERDKEHQEHLPYDDNKDFEATRKSYEKYGKAQPVQYVEYTDGDKIIKAVIDGWKYVVFARKAGLEKVLACKLNVGNVDDLLSLMLQLQISNHHTYIALFHMIQALWPKYCKGQGYRSDLSEEEYDKPVLGKDGKRLTINERVGQELNLKSHQVKYIRKIGMIDPQQFYQMDSERVALYKVYNECVSKAKGEKPKAPAARAPIHHSKPSGNATAVVPVTSSGETTGAKGTVGQVVPAQEVIPIGTVVDKGNGYIIVSGLCQHCGKQTFLKIPLSEIQ